MDPKIMHSQKIISSRGSSLVEMAMATLLTMVILMAGVALFRPAMDISYMLSQEAGMQQAGRFALDVFTTEFSVAGSGIPGGGVQLPTGTGTSPRFACSVGGQCYVTNNTFPGPRLYAVTPGDSKGTTINGVATDVVTFAYTDPESNLDQYPLTLITSDRAYFDAAMSPAYDDAATGARLGDVLMMCNLKGCAVGVVTTVHNNHVHLTEGSSWDPLKFNQPTASYGSFASIQTNAETRAQRLKVVTFYVDNSNPDVPRLMRQINTGTPQVAALYVENLQLSYDIFDENSSTVTTNLADAGGNPNQIRKVNISVGARSPVKGLAGRGYERLVLTTSVSPKSLRIRDYYQ